MKKIFLVMLVFCFSQCIFSQSFYENDYTNPGFKNRLLGFGAQAAMLPFGISIQWCLDDTYSLQGIAGYFGINNIYLSNFALKGKYRFDEIQETEPYLFLQGGLVSIGDKKTNVGEKIPSFSIGAGIDYNHSERSNFFSSYEIGYVSARTEKTDISFSTLYYSFALHYYYKR